VHAVFPPTTGRLPTPTPGYAIRITVGASALADGEKMANNPANRSQANLNRWVIPLS
jgi:hypothetical protein